MRYRLQTTNDECTIEARDWDTAIAKADEMVRDWVYCNGMDVVETFWVDIQITEILPVSDEDSDDYVEPESIEHYVEIDPIEPKCVDKHAWEDENDYIYQGSSGIGVSFWQICKKCGCGKHYDSGASGPTFTGGYTAIRYDRNRYAKISSY